MSRTIVFVHAHPDDEALLTAGTMARAVADGHRVVLITATDGALGMAAEKYTAGRGLASNRSDELDASCAAIGVHRLVRLGYADSGHTGEVYPDPPGQQRFVRAPVTDVADAIEAIACEEHADVLVGYDWAGGYGHRDHVHVHRATRDVARRHPRLRLLEATVPRETISRLVRAAKLTLPLPPDFDPREFDAAFTPRRAITHRINIGPFTDIKRAALAAHTSQTTTGDGTVRGLGALLQIPAPLFRLLLGHEWFASPDLPPGGKPRRDILADLG